MSSQPPDHGTPPEEDDSKPEAPERLKRFLFGSPRDLADKSLFHRISLIPILAWIGLGADGLSSSSYGPEEAFRTLGEHTFIAVGLAAAVGATVIIIAAAYSRIIEHFPHGGGGYIVATNLLGEKAGLISGSALLVDYMLTIAVSIASSGDALFSILPPNLYPWKFTVEVVLVLTLIALNIRGVKESVLAMAPIFFIFLITHLILILGGLIAHAPQVTETAHRIGAQYSHGVATLGLTGIAFLLVHAYSMGAGTYTGIEAVSNGLPIMREPRVHTAKRTMLYMAVSLAFTASGLVLLYLLWNVHVTPGKTMNAVLVERFVSGVPFGNIFVALTLVSEGALLIVAAQAGFIDGPRILANMATDYWLPRRFSALSDRLTTSNGVLVMGVASLFALFYTHGDVRALVVMYSINVFVTFSLSMFGMLRYWWAQRKSHGPWKGKASLFLTGFVLCATILSITIAVKFGEGGWLTLFVTGSLIILCIAIRRHYRRVRDKLSALFAELEKMPIVREFTPGPLDPDEPTAAVLVAGYSGLGIHTVLNIFRNFPGQYKNLVFLSVGVLDSEALRESPSVEAVRERTEESLKKYMDLAAQIGVPAAFKVGIGTDAVDEADKLCRQTAEEFPKVTFFAGKIIFQRERWYQKILHNETAFAIQKRLQWTGQTMVIIPAKVR